MMALILRVFKLPNSLRKTIPRGAYLGLQQRRHLNVMEHVSYRILNEAGIPTPKFGVAVTAKEAKDIAQQLATTDIVVKAQVLAGGRGVGRFKNGLKGGVRVVNSPEEAERIAGRMLKQYLVTKQTGPAGLICNKVMVAERKFSRREFYLAIMMERAFNGPVVIASAQGGVNIEDVAADDPSAIIMKPIDIITGLKPETAAEVARDIGLEDSCDDIVKTLQGMYKIFIERDALLVEINPYAEDVLEKSKFVALDAKLRFDDSAYFRQQDLFELRDITQENPAEVEASKYNMTYISLDGNIGCMVNGAGLAMATMDTIKLHGGEPANFLDVGGGSTEESVKQAFKLITSDPKVQCILVNIFGGIVRCDVIAEGIIAAAKELKLTVPVVARLQGTNMDAARKLIEQSGLRIMPNEDMDDAAQSAVRMAEIVTLAKELKMDISMEPKKEEADGDSPSYTDPCSRARVQAEERAKKMAEEQTKCTTE